MKKLILKIILVFLSGISLTLAFAPFRIDLLAFVCLIFLFYLLNKTKKIHNVFLISLSFGIGFFGSSISWIYISIYFFTESIIISLLIICVLLILLSLLHITPFAILSHIFTYKSNKLIKLLIYPSLWTFFEILKANLVLGGFPYMSLGYSQTESSLIWYANIGGVYLVTYIVVFISCLITFFICNKNVNFKKKIIVIIVIIILYLFGTLIKYSQHDIVTNSPQKVVLVQGFFVKKFKWDPNNLSLIQDFYKKIILKYNNSLIIFPENAIPNYRQHMSTYINSLEKIATKNNNAVLIGLLNIEKKSSTSKLNIYNSSIIVGNGQGIYNKHHLVPFGEYFPIISFKYINTFGLNNFSHGYKIQPLMLAFDYYISNFICYEAAYPEQIRNQLQNAKLISIISDYSWFGNSISRDQQLQISQVRAIENFKYVLTTTNNGITAIIEPNGKIIKKLPTNIRSILEKEIYLNDYNTIWMDIGMLLIWQLLIFSIILGILLIIKNKYFI